MYWRVPVTQVEEATQPASRPPSLTHEQRIESGPVRERQSTHVVALVHHETEGGHWITAVPKLLTPGDWQPTLRGLLAPSGVATYHWHGPVDVMRSCERERERATVNDQRNRKKRFQCASRHRTPCHQRGVVRATTPRVTTAKGVESEGTPPPTWQVTQSGALAHQSLAADAVAMRATRRHRPMMKNALLLKPRSDHHGLLPSQAVFTEGHVDVARDGGP